MIPQANSLNPLNSGITVQIPGTYRTYIDNTKLSQTVQQVSDTQYSQYMCETGSVCAQVVVTTTNNGVIPPVPPANTGYVQPTNYVCTALNSIPAYKPNSQTTQTTTISIAGKPMCSNYNSVYKGTDSLADVNSLCQYNTWTQNANAPLPSDFTPT